MYYQIYTVIQQHAWPFSGECWLLVYKRWNLTQISSRSLSNYLTFLIVRELPPLAKQFVMRLLYVEQAVPKAVVSSWVNSHTVGSSLSQANTALTDLGVWQEASMPGGLPAWILKNTFRQNLKIVLTGG